MHSFPFNLILEITFPSSQPVMKDSPPGEKHIERTGRGCPNIVPTAAPVDVERMRTRQSEDDAQTRCPEGLMAKAAIPTPPPRGRLELLRWALRAETLPETLKKRTAPEAVPAASSFEPLPGRNVTAVTAEEEAKRAALPSKEARAQERA